MRWTAIVCYDQARLAHQRSELGRWPAKLDLEVGTTQAINAILHVGLVGSKDKGEFACAAEVLLKQIRKRQIMIQVPPLEFP